MSFNRYIQLTVCTVAVIAASGGMYGCNNGGSKSSKSTGVEVSHDPFTRPGVDGPSISIGISPDDSNTSPTIRENDREDVDPKDIDHSEGGSLIRDPLVPVEPLGHYLRTGGGDEPQPVIEDLKIRTPIIPIKEDESSEDGNDDRRRDDHPDLTRHDDHQSIDDDEDHSHESELNGNDDGNQSSVESDDDESAEDPEIVAAAADVGMTVEEYKAHKALMAQYEESEQVAKELQNEEERLRADEAARRRKRNSESASTKPVDLSTSPESPSLPSLTVDDQPKAVRAARKNNKRQFETGYRQVSTVVRSYHGEVSAGMWLGSIGSQLDKITVGSEEVWDTIGGPELVKRIAKNKPGDDVKYTAVLSLILLAGNLLAKPTHHNTDRYDEFDWTSDNEKALCDVVNSDWFLGKIAADLADRTTNRHKRLPYVKYPNYTVQCVIPDHATEQQENLIFEQHNKKMAEHYKKHSLYLNPLAELPFVCDLKQERLDLKESVLMQRIARAVAATPARHPLNTDGAVDIKYPKDEFENSEELDRMLDQVYALGKQHNERRNILMEGVAFVRDGVGGPALLRRWMGAVFSGLTKSWSLAEGAASTDGSAASADSPKPPQSIPSKYFTVNEITGVAELRPSKGTRFSEADMKRFKVIGMLIALSLIERVPTGIKFTYEFMAVLLGRKAGKWKLEDKKFDDLAMYSQYIELIKTGEATRESIEEEYLNDPFAADLQTQSEAIYEGFTELLEPSIFEDVVRPEDLQRIIRGEMQISEKDLIDCIVFKDDNKIYKSGEPISQWLLDFFRDDSDKSVVHNSVGLTREQTAELRKKFFVYVTAYQAIPIGGLKDSAKKITIVDSGIPEHYVQWKTGSEKNEVLHKVEADPAKKYHLSADGARVIETTQFNPCPDASQALKINNAFPTASSCEFILFMPKFSSKELMLKYLKEALENTEITLE